MSRRRRVVSADSHLVPLQPGVPYEEQQLAALDWGRDGVLDLGAAELEELAAAIRRELR